MRAQRAMGPAAFVMLAALAAWSTRAAAADDAVLVLTALPVTYSLASALAVDTRIVVRNVPERPRPMAALISLLEQRSDRFAEEFAGAEAVVTIGKLWRDDPLFTAVRGENIRVVQIDATKPWSTTLEGVSVASEPAQEAPWVSGEAGGQGESRPSVYFWLSPANGARSAEIVAADLKRLAPDDAEQIDRNLAAYRERVLALKREYEVKLATLPDVTVFALAPEFVYLTLDMGLFVDGYFFKQDIDWTDDDLAAFEAHLRERSVPVVIHKWEPDERIRAAIEAAGSRLVVLDPIDVGVVEDGQLAADAYTDLLRDDLERLHAALAAAN